MANNQTPTLESTAGASAPKTVSTNSGRFQKGSERAREAGREGGKKSRRNS